MSYIEDNLMPNEKILFAARVHPAIFLPVIFSFILTIVLFVYGINNTAVVSSSGQPAAQATSAQVLGSALVCVSGFLFLFTIMLGIEAIIVKLTTEFAVTNRRVIAKTGFIRRHTLEMLLPKIESVAVNQSILGRILNIGTVTVTGTGGTKESFRGISDPVGVRRKINQIIEGYNQYQQRISNQRATG